MSRFIDTIYPFTDSLPLSPRVTKHILLNDRIMINAHE